MRETCACDADMCREVQELLACQPRADRFLELRLPIWLCAWRAMQPQLRVLFLGGYADGSVAPDQGQPPRAAILRKPYEPGALSAAVPELLG